MSESPANRRSVLKVLGASVGMSLLPRWSQAAPAPKAAFTYCLNMSSIRGQKLGFVKELEVASKAGYRSVEIWMDGLQSHLNSGATLADTRKLLQDLGLKVENAIGFANWIVDDDAARAKGVEQLQREMEMLAQIGCARTAAPPAGATKEAGLDLKKAAERYRTILELGAKTGVVPQLEIWGSSQNLNRTSEAMYVALESGHPSARVLLDIFHLYRGGSSVDTLPLISKSALEVFHINDYTAATPRATITDADRIYPGDGIAPIRQILQTIRNPDRPIVLSFEVFNKNYYAQDALVVAKTALAKMKAVTKGL
jgi:2-keto-myo-inositol isomerase